MKTFIFRNPGVIDPRSISTFGVSSKDNASTAIGFFGTGLKYAIAVCLRMGCQVTIYSGGDRYVFGVEQTRIRHDEFNVVTMAKNDNKPQPLAFTTELGKTWEMWQAFRELYCNMKDENGDCFDSDLGGKPFAVKTHTVVAVSGSSFEDAWYARHKIVLNTQPLFRGTKAEVHPGESDWIYYRGIRCYKTGHPTLYTYNITEQMALSEDRSFKHPWYADTYVSNTINEMTDEHMIDKVILVENMPVWEKLLTHSGPLSETLAQRAMFHMKKFDQNLNHYLRSKIHEVHAEDLITDDTDKLSAIDVKRLMLALQFLKKLGWDCAAYPIIVSEHLGENVLGRAINEKIYISKMTFEQGTKRLAGTILEEYVHLKHGHADCDHGMQNFLFDALMSMGERVTGDVL